MVFCLEGLRFGSLYCTETAVVEDVGTFYSLTRVNLLSHLGRTDPSQGLCPLGMPHLGPGAYGEGCPSSFLGVRDVPSAGRAPVLSFD